MLINEIRQIRINRSLVLCAELFLVVNKYWTGTNRKIIMSQIARQDIIGNL
jgi:hypothetical protein